MRVPRERGPLSRRVLTTLTGPVGQVVDLAGAATTAVRGARSVLADDDVQLGLLVLQELSHDGLDDVDDRWEGSTEVLAARAVLEAAVESELREQSSSLVRQELPTAGRDVAGAIFRLTEAVEGPSVAAHIQRGASRGQFQEFLVHRSVQQLREADAHTWLIPRLSGRPKAALVEIQADEYGGGRFERMHAQMFADTMQAAGLNPQYGYYLDQVPATTLAVTTTTRMFCQYRRLRGAAAGHLAAVEATSSIPSRRLGKGARRLGFGDRATAYFDEHVEADAVHEQLATRELCGRLVAQQPALLEDVLFGAVSCLLVDARAGAAMLDAWLGGASSLLPDQHTESVDVAG